jgi:hypothetical protein
MSKDDDERRRETLLRSLSAETSCKLNVLLFGGEVTLVQILTRRWRVTNRLDGDTLGVDCAQVGVLEEGDEISLNRLLDWC